MIHKCIQILGRGKAVVMVLIALSTLLPRVSSGYGKQLGVGIEAGYGASDRLEDSPPGTVHGGAFGIYLTYGLTESWGICLEGNFDLHAPYDIYVLAEVPGEEEGTTEVDYVKGPSVSSSYITGVTLSVVYVIDVMRLLPFVSLGPTYSRVDQKLGSFDRSGFEVGFRFSIGFDYRLLDFLDLGAVLHTDTFLTGRSEFYNRLAVLARITFVFDISKFGESRSQG